jgi:hypothetical protein
MRLPTAFLVVGALALAGLGVAAAGVFAPAGTTKSTVTVTEREFSIGLSKRKLERGIVKLVVRNSGKYPHALAVKGPGVAKRTPMLKPGKSAVLVVTLRSGSYTFWCPVASHAARGMKTTIAVAGASTSTQYVPPTSTGTTTDGPDDPPGY